MLDFKEKQMQQDQLEKEERRKQAHKRMETFAYQQIDFLMNNYGFNNKVANLIFTKAWESCHSYGYNEVQHHVEDLGDFVEKALILNSSTD